jgi:branched-chain amino acid transport system permease protein
MNFHYRQHGESDGVPMLLVHGSYATSRWWEPFLTILPEEILAVAPDLRGVGMSTRSAMGYEIDQQAADLTALVEALGWQECELVAHSSSGAIAIEWVLAHPEYARTLTLVDSVPLEGVYTPQETFELLCQMQSDRELLSRAISALMPALNIYGAGGPTPAALDFFNKLVEDAQQMEPEAFTAIAVALSNWDRVADSRYLRLPTLLVWGDQDIIVDRDTMTRTLLTIPGAHNLEVLRAVGHSPMIEAPQLLADRIIDFITEDFDAYSDVRRIGLEGSDDEH